MFYLIEFFKGLGESLLRGMSFFLLSCLLAFSLTHRPWISGLVEKITPEKMSNPYFITVMDAKVDALKFEKIVEKLPGVINVSFKDPGDDKDKISSLVSQLGNDYKISSDLLNFKSLRIALNPSMSRQSLEYVKDQIVNLGGESNLTASELKYPEITGMMKTHPFYQFLSKTGDWAVVGLLSVFWIISYILSYNIFRSRSYLIEKFQRKKLVAAKTLASGLALIMLGFSALGFLNGTLKLFDVVLLTMIFSVFWTFSMKDWRWKPIL
jgi:hypothetical protein